MVLSRLIRAVAVATVALAVAAAVGGARDEYAPVVWRKSRSLGLPWDGRLVSGVRLPAEGATFFTWDPALRRSPNRSWRRWGNDRLVRTVLDVLAAYAAAHPRAPRVGVGDLSRPHGGSFGAQFGGLGHASHQNGLDADVYYPRKDRRETAPTRPAQIDRRLAQDLVDRFVAAGARFVFVGPHTGLEGSRAVVMPLVHHDNHMHVRIPNPIPPRRSVLGHSAQGRRIYGVRLGDPVSDRRVLVVGCIHGDESAGIAVAKRLTRSNRLIAADLWVVPDLNPDGVAHGTRQNGRGVDLNRNFPSNWVPIGRRGSFQWSGPRPLSEPESRYFVALVRALHPAVTIVFHQHQDVVRAWGHSRATARKFAALLGVLPYRAWQWPFGTEANWQNHAFPGTASFVVELPAGAVPVALIPRYVRALRELARIGFVR